MANSSHVTHFTLRAYLDSGVLRWLYFLIILSVYVLIVLSNLFLIVVICFSQTLHKPMYIFLCSLFVNEIWGSTGLFPFLMLQILQDVHQISAPFCFVQIFLIFSYGHVELGTLAVMSYDQYMAICFPLQYHSNMTHTKVLTLIALTWLLLFAAVFILVSLSAHLRLCGEVINKVYCDNYSVIKLACSNITAINIYGMAHLCALIALPLSVILFTYIQIFRVCFSGSKQMRQKAMSTCVPHLASIINFALGVSFEILQSRFDMTGLPNMLRIFISIYIITVQPLLNPLMYGLKLTAVRITCKNVILRKTKSVANERDFT